MGVRIFCLVFFTFLTVVHGDTVRLKDKEKDIELSIINVTDEHVVAAIKRQNLKSISMNFLNSVDYPDAVSLSIPGEDDITIECKVRDIREDTIQLMIPVSKLSSLKIDFHPGPGSSTFISRANGGVKTSEEKAPHVETGMGKDVSGDLPSQQVSEALDGKDKMLEGVSASVADDGKGIQKHGTETLFIPEEIRTETVKEKQYRLKIPGNSHEETVNVEDIPGVDDLLAELGFSVGKDKKTEVKSPDQMEEKDDKDKDVEGLFQLRTGKVEGMIVRNSEALPDCRVKLQRLEEGGLFSKGYRPVEGAIEYETITDDDGRYIFENIPPGKYKIYWMPDEETAWVTRYKMEPDVLVEIGKTTTPEKIEVLKRTLN